uniref:Cyclin N-terminal domain-containing protein n=1 Tax=Chlamydomonas leiostraca TaxID=1034604 RepID=A0A7S0R765_9CHLO|mmetsp:Transcript_15218/g.37926  ORF Transcript_15218/g.37926 Transcript_15218/m.37926 type:complete len:345 (+) Transcript_15218:154-1188(+)
MQHSGVDQPKAPKSHAELQDQMRRELKKEMELQAKPKQKWEYKTAAELEASSPSRKDGLDPIKEGRWRREFMAIITKAGMTLRIPQWGIAVAGLLCHRFFSRKSMKRNDRTTVACACLHLAAKMEEAPKSIKDVVREVVRVRYARDGEALARALAPDELERYKEQVLVAERAVLYTLGFDLNTAHPYTFLVSQMSKLGLLGDEGSSYRTLMQDTWNFVNDSFRSTLCLQFPPDKIAAAALWLASHLAYTSEQLKAGVAPPAIKQEPGQDAQGAAVRALLTTGDGQQRPISGVLDQVLEAKSREGVVPKGSDFFAYFGVSREEMEAIATQILQLYEETKLAQAAR